MQPTIWYYLMITINIVTSSWGLPGSFSRLSCSPITANQTGLHTYMVTMNRPCCLFHSTQYLHCACYQLPSEFTAGRIDLVLWNKSFLRLVCTYQLEIISAPSERAWSTSVTWLFYRYTNFVYCWLAMSDPKASWLNIISANDPSCFNIQCHSCFTINIL